MTRAISLHEWSKAVVAGHFWRDAASRSTAAALARTGALSMRELRDGIEVEATSFVGRIEIDDLRITVTPKIGGALLLELIRYAFGLRDLRVFGAAEYGMGPLLEDLLVAQLHREASELLARGVSRRYVRTPEILASPRGRIDLQRLAAAGGLATAGLPCVHHPRSANFILNRVTLAGLHHAASVTRDVILGARVSRVAKLFGELAATVLLTASLLSTARRELNRLSASYEPALNIIQLLYDGTSLAMDDGAAAVRLSGFLFDMNRFFQALLARFLTDHLPALVVKSEHALHGMIRYDPSFNPRAQRHPTPRPDFVLFRGKRKLGIFDAKYRDLWATKLPREMLYQLAMYALADPATPSATILYPTMTLSASDAVLEIRGAETAATRARVVLRPVILPHLAAAIGSPRLGVEVAEALVRPPSHTGSPVSFVA